MRLIQKSSLVIAVIFVLLIAPACFADEAATLAKLTLEKCIAIALKEHPGVKAAIQTVNSALAKINIAKAAKLPSVELTSSYTNTSTSPDTHTSSAQVNLQQSLLDFGKRDSKISEKQSGFEAAEAGLLAERELVVFNVIQAYYSLLAARKIVDVNTESVTQFERRLNQAQGFYDVGKKPKIEVTKAELDLSNARLELIKAENAAQLAQAKLFNTMGLIYHTQYTIEDAWPKDPVLPDLSLVLRQAMDSRPEIIQAKWKRVALESTLNSARKEFFPEISGTAGYGWRSQWFPPESDIWSLGVNLTYPIYKGGLLTNQIMDVRSQLEAERANEANLQLAVRLEVEQSYYALKEAVERKTVAAMAEKQAEENFILAEGRYSVGFGSPLEYTDARLALTQARTTHVQAAYDAQIAYAALRKATGFLAGDFPGAAGSIKEIKR